MKRTRLSWPGAGTRLRPITYTSAKQLVPVANKPVLFYGLEAIADAGVTDVGLIVGDTAAEVMEAVGDGSAFGIKTTFIPQHAPLGWRTPFRSPATSWPTTTSSCTWGTTSSSAASPSWSTPSRPGRPARIMLTQVPNPREFGVAELDAQGRVVRLEEKPEQPKSDLALVGVYMFTSAVHDVIAELKPSWRDELEITEAIQMLIDSGQRVESSLVTGYWKDTGNVTDMLEVNRMVLETTEPAVRGDVEAGSELIGRVVIEHGARVQGSRIVGPAIIGADSQVTGSYVGPFTSVGPNCTLQDSEIEYSIVLAGASIRGVRRIEASLIGRGVEITPAPRVPKAHRLVLGDHSKVQISS